MTVKRILCPDEMLQMSTERKFDISMISSLKQKHQTTQQNVQYLTETNMVFIRQ